MHVYLAWMILSHQKKVKVCVFKTNVCWRCNNIDIFHRGYCDQNIMVINIITIVFKCAQNAKKKPQTIKNNFKKKEQLHR